ncbi:discoidin domain-containing protein [Virgibacillus sp. NKC19-3]|uniref:polysaccharide lyase family 8 super-sandwich domain-containing protein n=1 Tax=Virgibacillus saliphilus TaxID=2831674 RepID=UPI001C9AC865|nr:polysaccharide lyase family 8 super-sandwich domain-containing protein [Virgibacillus sp. NKC19-3]MBY7144404.1 discoidin domain-containing protein [Virgibacillus sp. NKC19-3]
MKKISQYVVAFTILMSILFGASIMEATENEDLLLNKDVRYAGVENGKNKDGSWKHPEFVGEMAVDGKDNTRWSADKQDDQWLTVDIGESVPISEIYLNFHAESPSYDVLISEDGETFESIFEETNGSNGQKKRTYINADNQTARYIKYQQNKMWEHPGNGQYYGSSIISIEAYSQPKTKSIFFDQESVAISEGRNTQLSYTLEPEGIEIKDEDLIWKSENEHIATVQDGTVTAISEGNTNVTLQIRGTDLTATAEITVTKVNEDYQSMRAKWKERLLGSNVNDNDPDIKNYLHKISEESEELWETLNKDSDRTYLWERKASDTVSADYTTQFTNIKKLTLGYYEPTSSIYQDTEVKQEIINAIDFMIDTKQYNGTYWTGNWWDWQIGSAQPLVDTLILLHDDLLEEDYEKLEKFVSPIKKYAKDPNIQWPNYPATGANLTDIALSTLGSAILLEDDSSVQLVEESVPSVLENVTSGDGLYTDGSLVQHTFFPYNGSYGNELLKGVGRIQSLLQDTEWEIDDNNMSNLFNVVDKGYLQLMTYGKMPSMVSGRSISRAPGTNPFTTEFESGKETIANLLLIADFAPAHLKNKIHAHIKEWVIESEGYYNFYQNPRDLGTLIELKTIMEDESIVANEDKTTLNIYASMDRVLQKTPTYSIGISMYSDRIANYEFGNTENKHGWHTADGMVYLNNGDLAQFDEGYWATIDPYRLPGTTVDTRKLSDGANASQQSPQNWVGGTTNGENAAVGMYLDKSNEGMDLNAKKSWFLLDGSIINLGADISGVTDASIETILDNRLINPEEVSVMVNGHSFSSEKEDVTGWINISAEEKENNIGYIIPEEMGNVSMYQEQRVGKYSDINEYFVSDKEYRENYLTITKNHGKSVDDDTYEYMVAPGENDEEMETLANNPHYSVLANNRNVQAIESNDVMLANFWNGGQKAGIVKVEQPMSVLVQSLDNNQYEITMANPLQNNEQVSLELREEIREVISNDEEMTVEGNTITLDSNQLYGASKTLVIEVAEKNQAANVNDIKTLIEQYDEEGAFASAEIVRHLQTHLTAVSHYEDKEEIDKVIQHLKGFKDLLNYQLANNVMPEEVHDNLVMQTDGVIAKLQ